MTVKVIYYTKGKDLAKMANIIGETCNADVFDITKPHVLGEVDMLFVGLDERSDKTNQDVMGYLNMLPPNTIKGATIFSVSKTSNDNTELISNLLLHKGISIYNRNLVIQLGSFFSKHKHLNEEDIKKTKDYAKEVLNAFIG